MSIVGKSQSGRACAEPASRPSAPRSGGGAKRRALTSVSTRARCWLDDAAGDHNILRSTRVQFLSVPRARQHVGSVSGAERVVVITGGYQTRDGSTFELEFRGQVSDAQLLKEFLEPQLRDASDKTIEATFELTFEKGLPMQGEMRRMRLRTVSVASPAALPTFRPRRRRSPDAAF